MLFYRYSRVVGIVRLPAILQYVHILICQTIIIEVWYYYNRPRDIVPAVLQYSNLTTLIWGMTGDSLCNSYPSEKMVLVWELIIYMHIYVSTDKCIIRV